MSVKPIQISTFYKGYISRPAIIKISGGMVIAIAAIALAILAHYDISGANVSIFKGIGAMNQTGIFLLIGSGSFLLPICLAFLFKKIKILENMKRFNDKEKFLTYFASLEKKEPPMQSACVPKVPRIGKYMLLAAELDDAHLIYTVLQSTATKRTVTIFYVSKPLSIPQVKSDEPYEQYLLERERIEEKNDRQYSQSPLAKYLEKLDQECDRVDELLSDEYIIIT